MATSNTAGSEIWPLAKSFLFVFVVPGFLAGCVPILISWYRPDLAIDTGIVSYAAIPLWIAGALVLLSCAWCFGIHARSSPAHFDMPQRLILHGPYLYMRNPMYVAQLLAVFGYMLWFGSPFLAVWLAIYVIGVLLLAYLYEEPLLRRLFGESYEHYRRNVSAWIPRLTPYEQDA